MSSVIDTSCKPFEPGTTGWTASDLDDPRIERQWFAGRYEIVEGVLTKMPPAYFAGGASLFNLLFGLRKHVDQNGPKGAFSVEVDIVVDESRVSVADAVFLTDDQRARQDEMSRRAGKADADRTRILIPPLLIIESVSPGHELHDQRTKRRWYAEFGVANYWILDAYARSLQCLILRQGDYAIDVAGEKDDQIAPSAFPGLRLNLAELWRI